MKIHTALRSGFGALCCALLAIPLFASPPGQGKTGLGPGGVGGGNDDIGSLPDSVPPDAPSLLLHGSAAAVAAVLVDVAGPGEVLVHRLGGDRVLVELEGSLHVQLDAVALAEGHVTTWFHTGTSFAGELGFNQLREIPLPVLAGGASLQVANREGLTFALAARSTSDGLLHVRQILR